MALSDAERAKLYRERHREIIASRTCPTCQRVFTPVRKDTRFCTTACRAKAWRQR